MSGYAGVRTLVTGAAGFIGSHLTERLVRVGARVRAVVRYNSLGRSGWLEDVADDVRAAIEVVHGDVRDADQVRRWVNDVDIVFHLAALIGIPYSYEAVASYSATNIDGTRNVLEACRSRGVRRLVHTSTSEVFGSAVYVPMDESHPRTAQSPYAATKIAADAMVQAYFHTWGVPAVTLRPFNTYGPRQSARAVIPTIISQIAAGKGEIELGATTPTRDFLFVRDTAAAFAAVGVAPGIEGQNLNAGTGVEISIGDLVQLVASQMQTRVSLAPREERLRPETSEVMRLVADASRLLRATDWRPETDLAAGLAETIAWIRRRPEAYRPSIYSR